MNIQIDDVYLDGFYVGTTWLFTTQTGSCPVGISLWETPGGDFRGQAGYIDTSVLLLAMEPWLTPVGASDAVRRGRVAFRPRTAPGEAHTAI